MGAKSVRKQKCFGQYLLKARTYESVNRCKGSFLKLCKALVAISYDENNLFRCARNIFKGCMTKSACTIQMVYNDAFRKSGDNPEQYPLLGQLRILESTM